MSLDNWKAEISTPALIVDYNILQRNIRKMAEFTRKFRMSLRPHMKTHKCPQIARMQLEAGAEGFCVAKISEAEVFAANGFDDILIANEIVSPEKIQRLLELNESINIMVCVDSQRNIEALEKLAGKNNQKLQVVIDLNVGTNRTGVLPGEPALELAKQISHSSHLKLHGLQAYEGHLTYLKDFAQKEERTNACMKMAVETKQLIENAGIECETISAGGTGTYMITGKYPGITELQPGTYVFNDHHINSTVPEFEIALTILTTINNKPIHGIFTLDMGSKSISNDMGDPQFKGYGRKIKVLALSEEHCQCTYSPKVEVEIGDKIEAIPAHVCPTVNLYDFFYVIQKGEIIDKWPIPARGMRE